MTKPQRERSCRARWTSLDIVAHRPDDLLLVQRNMPELLLVDLERLADHAWRFAGSVSTSIGSVSSSTAGWNSRRH